MSSTWPNEALWVNYWSPKSADPRVWQGNDHDNSICKKCGLVMPRWNIRDTNVLGAMQFFGKCNVFTFCPAAVDLFEQKAGCFPLSIRKKIKPILDAAIFELPWSVASLLRFAGCIPDHISTYENTGVLHYHNKNILVIPLVPTSTP